MFQKLHEIERIWTGGGTHPKHLLIIPLFLMNSLKLLNVSSIPEVQFLQKEMTMGRREYEGRAEEAVVYVMRGDPQRS